MDQSECRHRFGAARVARLATMGTPGPHLVPIVFALHGDRLFTAVDDKPKRSTRLQRVINIKADPHVSVLVDEYADDWGRLWWVRADGTGRLLDSERERTQALDLLAAKYEQYQRQRPGGDVIEITVERWTGWSAAEGANHQPDFTPRT